MPTVKGKSGKAGSGKAPYKKGAKPSGPKTSSTGGISKSKSKPTVTRPAVQQKSKSFQPVRKKKRIYTEKELDIPKLNMITPAGVTKPKGQKKGKIFVDDQESMMTILAMVNADKEGQIESKMMKARQMEEIRQARQREMDVRQEERKSKLEATKDSLRKKRKKGNDNEDAMDVPIASATTKLKKKKRVSFG